MIITKPEHYILCLENGNITLALLPPRVLEKNFMNYELFSVYVNIHSRRGNGTTLGDMYCFWRHLTSFLCDSGPVHSGELILLHILKE